MKLKAFTILELLIGMVLSAILFGMALGAYQLLQKQYIRYESDSTQSLAQLHAFALLEKDIALCKTMSQQEDSLVCYFDDKIIAYVPRDSVWLRSVLLLNLETHLDTLHFFRARFQLEEDSIVNFSNLNIPTQLKLIWYPTLEDSITWTYPKTYSRQALWQKLPPIQ